MAKQGWKKIKQADYKQLKGMVDAMVGANVSLNRIGQVIGRSWKVVEAIKTSTDYANYRDIMDEYTKSHKKTNIKPVVPTAPSADAQPGAINQTLRLILQELIKLNQQPERKPFWRQ